MYESITSGYRPNESNLCFNPVTNVTEFWSQPAAVRYQQAEDVLHDIPHLQFPRVIVCLNI